MTLLTKSGEIIHKNKNIVAGFVIFMGIYLFGRLNYLFFHAMVEGLGIIVAILIYILATRTYRFSGDTYLHFLGHAYLSVAILNFFHTLTFQGMGVSFADSMNVSKQFWIAERYVEGMSLLIAPLILKFNFNWRKVFWGYIVYTWIIILSIMRLHIYPECYKLGQGFTAYKVVSEYIVSIMIFGGIILLWKKRKEVNSYVCAIMTISMLLNVAAGVFFAADWISYEMTNATGHILKTIAYLLIYSGLIIYGLETPYNLIFKELTETNSQLAALNEKKNQFIGMAAHDLRNPLSIIMMSSQILTKTEGLNNKQLKNIQHIKSSSEYMLKLVEEILDITKIEAGKLNLNLEYANVISIIENNVALNQEMANEKHIALNFKYSEGIPNKIMIDQLKIEQVINNLISNAIKFSHSNTNVFIYAYCDKENLVILVQDEGQGIPTKELGLLFNPFDRTSVKATAGEKGSGLGLAISRRIVEGHHGKIWVESEVGKGTKFYVSIPIIF